MPAAVIESFNVDSLAVLVFIVIQRNGNHCRRHLILAWSDAAITLKQGDAAHRSATTVIRILPSFPDN